MKTGIKTSKKMICILLISIIVIACGIYITSVVYVNHKFQKVGREVHQVNEQFEWHNFNVTVNKYELMTADDINKRWSTATIAGGSLGDNDKIMVAEIQVEYTGEDSTASFPITKVCGQSGAWSNASEYTLLNSINDGFKCKKGEVSTFYTAINVKQIMFSKAAWKNYANRDYELVFSTYPNIVSVELN